MHAYINKHLRLLTYIHTYINNHTASGNVTSPKAGDIVFTSASSESQTTYYPIFWAFETTITGVKIDVECYINATSTKVVSVVFNHLGTQPYFWNVDSVKFPVPAGQSLSARIIVMSPSDNAVRITGEYFTIRGQSTFSSALPSFHTPVHSYIHFTPSHIRRHHRIDHPAVDCPGLRE